MQRFAENGHVKRARTFNRMVERAFPGEKRYSRKKFDTSAWEKVTHGKRETCQNAFEKTTLLFKQSFF